MKIYSAGLFLALAMISTGCATVRGDKQKVRIDSDPTGADLTINDKSYKTPAEVVLVRKQTYKVTVAKPGYQPIMFNYFAQWDGASMTDVALPGGSALMGLSVATGSDKSFDKLAVITLKPTTEPSPKTLEVFLHRGKLLTKSEFDKAIADEQADKTRFMGTENP